jgi:hypothetical protein
MASTRPRRVAGDELDPGQPAGDQVAEERQPAGAVFGAGDVQAEDLPVALCVHTHGQQRVHVDRAPALAHLEHQRVRGNERIRTGVQWPGAERLDLFIERLGHLADLRLGQAGDAQGMHQPIHPPCAHAEQVAGRHHAGQRRLRPALPLQQPIREVTAGAQLRQRQLHRAGAGIPLPSSVAVALRDPLDGAFAVRRAADRVRLGAHQRLGEGLDHAPQQIGARLRQLLVQPTRQVDTGPSGHRRDSSLELCGRNSLRITRWPSQLTTPRSPRRRSDTTFVDATLRVLFGRLGDA